ncbi:hypothetical protein D3C72_718300 [compost metagenome]
MPTQRAIAASSWLAMPKSGQSELMPPRGSITPWYRNQPQPATTIALVRITPGYQLTWPRGFQTWPSRSWTMKRPTRVPASMVVRMKSASNMIAKWYQSPIMAGPPSTWEKSWAMPRAKVGAPPVRAKSVSSPTRVARRCMSAVVTGKPQPEMVATAASGVAPTTAAAELTAK